MALPGAKIGPLVGTRTWGGLVGISGYPPLMDGGSVTAAWFGVMDTDGNWAVENVGVSPDVTVELEPSRCSLGHDPQLEKAVELALDALEKNPPPVHQRPPYPDSPQAARGDRRADSSPSRRQRAEPRGGWRPPRVSARGRPPAGVRTSRPSRADCRQASRTSASSARPRPSGVEPCRSDEAEKSRNMFTSWAFGWLLLYSGTSTPACLRLHVEVAAVDLEDGVRDLERVSSP